MREVKMRRREEWSGYVVICWMLNIPHACDMRTNSGYLNLTNDFISWRRILMLQNLENDSLILALLDFRQSSSSWPSSLLALP